MSVLPWVFLLFLASQPVDQMPVSTSFERDEDYVRSAIESGDVARAMIASTQSSTIGRTMPSSAR